MTNLFSRLFLLPPIVVAMIFSSLAMAEIVEKIGVATPQAGESSGNVEKLRARAIRNAMELAVMQVSGAEVTSDRGGLNASRDTIVNINGETDAQQKQTASYYTGAKTKISGNVKIVEIIKEWQEGEKYFVELKLNVKNEDELLKSLSAGDLWARIGKPAIGINVSLNRNGQQSSSSQSLQQYLEDNLSRNELDMNIMKGRPERFTIDVKQTIRNAAVASMGTYKTYCELSFSIIDSETQRSLSGFRLSHGPDGGFDERQAEERCTKAIVRDFSEKMLNELAIIFSGEWNNGKDFIVSLASVPGGYTSKSGEIIANAYLVTASEVDGFDNGVLRMSVAYKGKGVDLVSSVETAFFEAGMRIELVRMNGNQIEFTWVGIEEL